MHNPQGRLLAACLARAQDEENPNIGRSSRISVQVTSETVRHGGNLARIVVQPSAEIKVVQWQYLWKWL